MSYLLQDQEVAGVNSVCTRRILSLTLTSLFFIIIIKTRKGNENHNPYFNLVCSFCTTLVLCFTVSLYCYHCKTILEQVVDIWVDNLGQIATTKSSQIALQSYITFTMKSTFSLQSMRPTFFPASFYLLNPRGHLCCI